MRAVERRKASSLGARFFVCRLPRRSRRSAAAASSAGNRGSTPFPGPPTTTRTKVPRNARSPALPAVRPQPVLEVPACPACRRSPRASSPETARPRPAAAGSPPPSAPPRPPTASRRGAAATAPSTRGSRRRRCCRCRPGAVWSSKKAFSGAVLPRSRLLQIVGVPRPARRRGPEPPSRGAAPAAVR